MLKRNLIADFHVHTRFSDGQHTLREIVDFYGLQGFGAIVITDHICEENTWLGQAAHHLERTLTRESFAIYQEQIAEEAERAMRLYQMLVLPGFEISKNSLSNHKSAHILGIGCTKYVSADESIENICNEIHNQGGIAVAAHPVWTRRLEKQTLHLWDNKEHLSNHFDAWEVASGPHYFDEVKQSRLPMLANGDVHSRKQITSWKTTLRTELHPQAVLDDICQQKIDFVFYREHFSYDYKMKLTQKSLYLNEVQI
jgi:hypothetical protein